MSLYNNIFLINKFAPILLKILNLDQPNGYDTGRFRDIYLSEDKKYIILYTRNGGEIWEKINNKLMQHPNFVEIEYDEFDPTYVSFVFSIPKKYKKLCSKLTEKQITPEENWKNLLKLLKVK